MANIFKEAKKYQRKHPRVDWQQCIQHVKKKTRKKSKPVKNRQTGRSNKAADRQRHARRPGIRKSKSGNTYYERRKNRSDVPGMLTGVSERQMKTVLKERYKERLGKVLVRKSFSGKRDARKLGKQATEIKRSIRKLD